MEEEEISVDEAEKLLNKRTKDLIRKMITKLEEMIKHERISPIELIMMLQYSLMEAIRNMIDSRPDILPKISLEKTGLNKLYKELKDIEEEEGARIRRQEKKRLKENH